MKNTYKKTVPILCAAALWFAAASCAENNHNSSLNAADITTTAALTESSDNNEGETPLQTTATEENPTSETSISEGKAPDPSIQTTADVGVDDDDSENGWNDLEKSDVRVYLEETEIPLGTKSITLKYEYVGEDKTKEACFGVEYTLEKLENGEWKTVEFGNNAAFISIGVIIGGESVYNSTSVSLDDSFYKNPLTKGEYRIIKDVGGNAYTVDFSIV